MIETKRIDLSEWEQAGEGSTAKSYYHKTDKTLMLKLFSGMLTDKQYVENEFQFSKELERLGFITPKAYEFVQCNDQYGIIYERLADKKSYSKLCADNLADLEKFANKFVSESYKLHQTQCDSKIFKSRSERLLEIANTDFKYSKITRNKLISFANKYSDKNTCLHGDLQTGNLVQSQGKDYWIDLSHFAYGDPIFDLACIYFFYVSKIGLCISTRIMHMNIKTLKKFGKIFFAKYAELSNRDLDQLMIESKNALLAYYVFTIDLENYTGLMRKIMYWYLNNLAKKIYV